MIDQVIIHCGSYKTGTSSIQNFMHANQEALARHAILYPRTGVVTKSPEMGYRHSRFMYKKSHKPYLFRKLKHELSKANARKVIFSTEVISDAKYDEGFYRWLDVVQTGCAPRPEIKGVLYLRNRCAYMQSYYREFVRRHGHTQNFSDFIQSRQRVFDYPRLLNKLAQSFGQNLDCHVYEQKGNTCQHFVDNYAQPITYARDFPKSNPSTNVIEAEIHRQLNIVQNNQRVSASLRRQIIANHPFGEIVDLYSETISDALAHTPESDWQALSDFGGFSDDEISILLSPVENKWPIEELSGEIEDYCLSYFSGRRQKISFGWQRDILQPQWVAK